MSNNDTPVDKFKVADLLLKVLSALVFPLLLWASNISTELTLLKREVAQLEEKTKSYEDKEEKLIEKLNKQAQDLALLNQKIGQVKEDSDELRRKLGK